jgi:hypothetical protein
MEDWNIGKMESWVKYSYSHIGKPQYSVIPLFHHSNFKKGERI